MVNVPFTFILFGCVSDSQKKHSSQQKLLDHRLVWGQVGGDTGSEEDEAASRR